MKTFISLTSRNIKLFFRDKGLFFTSLATPLILLVLYATFLRNVYRDTFVSVIPEGISVPDELLEGLVGGQLVSSLLAVSCVTVAFCSNMLSVQDKVNGVRADLEVTPLRAPVLSASYYTASLFSTLLICFGAAAAGFIYLGNIGWYLTGKDVLSLILDIFLLVTFGTALSSIVNLFLSSQGQISAVGSIISSVYGFICGAYMPMSQFGETLQTALTFLPGTYGTALVRTHTMRNAFSELAGCGLPEKMVEELKTSFDCNIEFGGEVVPQASMYAILGLSCLFLLTLYIALSTVMAKRKKK